MPRRPIIERTNLWAAYPDAVLVQLDAVRGDLPRRLVLRAATLLVAQAPPERAASYPTLNTASTRIVLTYSREGRLAVRRICKLRFHRTLPWMAYYGLTVLRSELDVVLALPPNERDATLARVEARVYMSSLEVKPCPIPSTRVLLSSPSRPTSTSKR